MKLIVLILTAFLPGILASLYIGYPQEKTVPKKCSEVVDGLQFCTTTPRVAVQSGNNVVIKLSLKNTTDKPVSIPVGAFEDYYDVTITGSNGEKISSIRDSLIEKINKGEMSNDEWIKTIKFGSRRKPISIESDGESSMELNLSQFYDFTRPDTYQVTIARRLKDKLGKDFLLSFGTMTIEVQGAK
jgi:hypothetical protein